MPPCESRPPLSSSPPCCCHRASARRRPRPRPATPSPLYAAIFKTGPKWDTAKAPNEQPFFREHSANLAKLRAAGTIVMGARYADIGLVVVTAATEADARKLFESDPSIAGGTFTLDVHRFSVFYPASSARPRAEVTPARSGLRLAPHEASSLHGAIRRPDPEGQSRPDPGSVATPRGRRPARATRAARKPDGDRRRSRRRRASLPTTDRGSFSAAD